MADGLVGVDQNRPAPVAADVHDRRQAIEGIVIDPGAIEGELPDPGQPAGEAALRLLGGLAAAGVETPETDQAAGVSLHHLHDVVVVQFEELWVLPGEAEDDRLCRRH